MTEGGFTGLAGAMNWLEKLELGDAEQIAVQYTPKRLRAKLATLFALDRRLGQLIAQTSEPALGQMRLAWWRDVLSKDPASRPTGDIVLDAIGAHWVGAESQLSKLVDGWEYMLSDPPLSELAARNFINGRVRAIQAGTDGDTAVEAAARRWACADATAHTSQEDERALFVRIGLEESDLRPHFSQPHRGMAVLNALSLRALKRGGRPLMEGRGAALTAIRAGIIRK